MDAEDVAFRDVGVTADDAGLWPVVLYGQLEVGYDIDDRYLPKKCRPLGP